MTMAEKESGEAAKEPNLARQAFMRNGAEELRQDMKPELDMCQGVAATDYNEAWSYLIQSASAGNAEAAGYFYMAPPVSADVDTVELQRIWSEHREEYRDMAIRAGNVHVLNAASVLEGMGIGPYGARVQYPPSLYNALKFATALGPLDARRKPGDENPYLDLFRPKLSEQEFADAQREGEQLRETYFQGIKPVDDPQQSGKPRPERCAGR